MSAVVAPDVKEAVREIIFREATYLDRRRWDDWIDLYSEDAVFWVPSWVDEENLVDDPEISLNLMYLVGRATIAARIFRLRTNDSVASQPLDRTSHMVDMVLVNSVEGGKIEATANWMSHSYGHGGSFTRSGYYDFHLVGPLDALKIGLKKIVMIDDRFEGPVDFYHI